MSETLPSDDYDIVVKQYSTYKLDMLYKDENGNLIDTTGFKGKMQVRPTRGSSIVLFEASSDNGMIQFGGIDGRVRVKIPYTSTGNMLFDRGFYNLIVISPADDAEQILEGVFTVQMSPTRLP